MNLLLITDNNNFSDELKLVLNENKLNVKIFQSNFCSESIKKIEKHFCNSCVCIIYSDNKIDSLDFSRLAFAAGNLVNNEVVIISNIELFSEIKLCSKSKIQLKNDSKSIISYFIKQFKNFDETSKKIDAKRKLFNLGIPLSADCFSLYMGKKNKEEICQMFIDSGIDINSKDDNGTPILNNAVRNENIELVKQIINLGADINCISDDRGYTPVMDAVWKGNNEITEYLIKKGADLNTINKEGQNNLVLAVGANKTEICKLLVENGANPDIKDSMGMSAYGYASLFKKEEILKILKPYHKE